MAVDVELGEAGAVRGVEQFGGLGEADQDIGLRRPAAACIAAFLRDGVIKRRHPATGFLQLRAQRLEGSAVVRLESRKHRDRPGRGRDQGRVRVNAQLIDVQSGAHLWADRFEEDVADLFKLQDEVVARLANSLGTELVKAEARGDRRIANLDAFDLTTRGLALNFELLRRPTRETNNAMRALYEQALAINPDEAAALSGDATTYLFDKINSWASADVDFDAKILGQADRSIAIAPNDPDPYNTKSLYLSYVLHRTEEGLRAANAGLALNPGSALLYHASAVAKNQIGMYAEAKSDVLHAIQLSPREPNLGVWQSTLTASDIGLGHFDDAIDDSHRAIDAGYRTFPVYSNLAVACAMSNRVDDARAAVAEALKLNPKYSVKLMSERYHKPPVILDIA
jgi:tetratricopeptide (TPR) repeat protein